MRLTPDPTVTPEDLERGRRALVRDAAWATLVGALYGGVILVGLALDLGATPLHIGLLAAIPFFAQSAQLPAIALIERLRQRRKICVLAITLSRLLIVALALIPFVPDRRLGLELLLAAQLAIALAGSVGGCAFNAWLHQILARDALGALFSRRLFWATLSASAGALAAGYLVQNWPQRWGERLHAYSVTFIAAGAAGMVSTWYLTRVPEPAMAPGGPPAPLFELLRTPFRDVSFRRVIVFMASWNFAANIAAPFLTVYLLMQLGYGLGTVTTLWMTSQGANALTMYLWGRLSDRLSNKAILAVALPAYFGCLVGLPCAAIPQVHALTLPLLYVIHFIMGAATGGIGLATGNLGLKLAPHGMGTAYLGAVGLAGSAAGGLAAISGGALADWFASRELTLTLHWAAPRAAHEMTVLTFRHWEFLFAISFALGWYVLHALSRIREGREHSERMVLRELIAEAFRSLDQLAPLLLPLGRLRDRRLKPR